MGRLKIVDSEYLDGALTTVADAIRQRTGETEQMQFPDGYVEQIGKLGQSDGENLMDRYLMNQLTEFSSDIPGPLVGYAFSRCSALVSVSFPHAQTGGTYLFHGCISLRKVRGM